MFFMQRSQNIYAQNELEKEATSSKMELVQEEAGRLVKRKVDFTMSLGL